MTKRKRSSKGASSSKTTSTDSSPSSGVAAHSRQSHVPPPFPSSADIPHPDGDIDAMTNNEDVPQKPKTRGGTMLRGFFKAAAKNKTKIQILHNHLGQPIGDTTKFESVCGVISRMGTMLPLTIPDWGLIPEPYIVSCINFLKRYFTFDEKVLEPYIRKDIGKKWKEWKNTVRGSFDVGKSIEHNLTKAVDNRVDPHQWAQLVPIWNSEKSQEISDQAKESRAQLKVLHTSGRKTFARRRDEMEIARGGAPVGEIEFFQDTHTHKDGNIDDDANGILHNCNNIIEEKGLDIEEVNNSPELQAEIMTEVRGKERPGRVRGRGLGPTPSMFVRSNSIVKADMEKMKRAYDAKLEDIKRIHDAQLEEMRAEMKKSHDAQLEEIKAEMRAMRDSFIANKQSQVPPRS